MARLLDEIFLRQMKRETESTYLMNAVIKTVDSISRHGETMQKGTLKGLSVYMSELRDSLQILGVINDEYRRIESEKATEDTNDWIETTQYMV